MSTAAKDRLGSSAFLKACRRERAPHTPVRLMRQAGRYLPEYRALRERHSRAEMLAAPELAVEATPQPLKRFPLDAAINLGHGILPETPIDSVSRMADYVHSWKGGAG